MEVCGPGWGMFKKRAGLSFHQHMKLILPDGSTRDIVHDPAPASAILIEAGFNPVDVLVARSGNLITEDTLLEADDEIRIIRISHGG